MRYTECGTYKENLKSTASLYVVVIPHGIGEAVLISLTACAHVARGLDKVLHPLENFVKEIFFTLL